MISLPASLERLAPPPGPRIEAELCVRRRLPEASCRRCAESCPRGAITLGRQPAIDPALCTGCLLCSARCPTGALPPAGGGLVGLLPHLETLPAPVLGCRRSALEAHARVDCLGLLASVETLLLLALHLPRGATLNLAACRGCENAPAIHKLKTALEPLRRTRIGARIRLAEAPGDLRFEEERITRRSFFDRLRVRPARAAADLLQTLQPSVRGEEPKAKGLPPVRAHILSRLPTLPEAIPDELSESIFRAHAVSSACAGCAGCVGICPTGALHLARGPGKPPGHHPDRCIGCETCLAFCRRGAVTLSRGDHF